MKRTWFLQCATALIASLIGAIVSVFFGARILFVGFCMGAAFLVPLTSFYYFFGDDPE